MQDTFPHTYPTHTRSPLLNHPHQWEPPLLDEGDASAAQPAPLVDATMLTFDTFDIGHVLRHGKLLLGSTGSEYKLTAEMKRMSPKARLQQQRAMLEQQLNLKPEHEAHVDAMLECVRARPAPPRPCLAPSLFPLCRACDAHAKRVSHTFTLQ